ncbi:hypothetical protein GIB67_026744 [Kingdonia uniflora]|uniref:Uncharacterized protein n=1 Tax=Kingdonia uniflora TaxID=39325 RepID=A0A7J7MHS1_9MAGN|nr:hypothetical protein GIB67_026744 [Kingdonia uniflora]
METSLRYGGSSSNSLRIHAKEKLPIDSKTFFQVHGELDTEVGRPNYCSALVRHFYPEISASLGVGLQYDQDEKFRYTVRGKKSFPISSSGLVSLNVKGRCDSDKEFQERKGRAAAELSWSLLNFKDGQDVRLRVGYEMFEKVPYMQVRENNWTLNADINGKWNVRFDL